MTMDIRLTEVERGRAVFSGVPQEFHYNPLGTVHGGYGATLLDSAMGCAVHSTLDPGDIYTTLELKINYIRALTHETGLVRGIGKVLSETRTTAIAEGRIEDGEGRLYAFATTTCAVRRSEK
ncbi:MAG: PaaI family thioesterase [Acidimicrobiia bacterium]|nr:PaaI family thioesterase [Acidimicrobiia bacterium]